MPSSITSSTSVENLRKSAKAWLKALRAGDVEALARFARCYPDAPTHPVLRDVQHALALEYGAASWIQLKQAVERRAESGGPTPGLHPWDVYERLAQDLVLAHGPRNAAALARLNSDFRTAFSFDDVSAFAWQRVYAYRQRASAGDRTGITLPEAQMVIAQHAGFGSWEALAKGVADGRPPIPPFVIDRAERTASPRRAMSDGDWDQLIDAVRDQQIARLETSLLTDDLLARVADLPHVTSLHLGGSRQLTDSGLQQLVRMPQLEYLNLSEYPGGRFTDRGLDMLRHLPNLKVFEMTWQKGISDAGVANLRHCDKLERVDLMGSPTGDGAIEALQGKPFLSSFSTGRLVTDAGLRLLKNFPQFQTRNAETPGGRLLIDGPFTNGALANLSPLEGVVDLDLFWHVSRMTTEGFAYLVDMPNLERLGADGKLSDNGAMMYFARMPRLKRLRAQEAAATDEGFQALSRSKTLEALWGRRCEGLRSNGFTALSTMPALRSLGVDCSHVEDWALAKLPDFPSLREITPVGMQDAGFRHIGRCERLERLTCMYCRESTDAATAQIVQLPLKYYYAGLTLITDRSLELLATMPTLEEIELYECGGITDSGVTALEQLPRLREMGVAGCPGVTFEGTRAFRSSVRVKYST